MKDYKLELRIKNNLLLSSMSDRGIKTASHLSRLSDVSVATVGAYLRLEKSPFHRKSKKYTQSIIKISEVLGRPVDDLFPEVYILEKSKFCAEIDFLEMEKISETIATPKKINGESPQSKVLNFVLDTLTPREAEVLRRRFGIGHDVNTLKQIGDLFGLSKERIRSIESKALRKMRHPDRSKHLKQING